MRNRLLIKEYKDSVFLYTIVTILLILFFIIFPNVIIKYNKILLGICFLVGFCSIKYTFTIMLISYTQFFSLFANRNFYTINFVDFAFFSFIGCFFSYFIRNKNINLGNRKIFKAIVVFYFTIFSSIFMSYFNWGQPLIKSLISFRQYLPLLLYIPIGKSKYFKKEENLIEYVSNICIFVSILLIIQYYFLPEKLILQVYESVRLGERRYLIHLVSPLIIFSICINLFMLLKNFIKYKFWDKTIKTINILIMIIAITNVSKTRVFIISLYLCMFYIFFNAGDKKSKYIKYFIVSIILLITINPTIYMIITKMNNMFYDVISLGDNYGRIKALTGYCEYLGKIPIMGSGIVTKAYSGTPIINLEANGFILSDLGIFSFFYQFGIQGIIGLIYLLYRIKCYLKKCNNEILRISYKILIITIIFQSITVTPWQQVLILFIILIFTFNKD